MAAARESIPLLFSNASDSGCVRSVNEDSFAYFRQAGRHLFVVADGMGGEAGGRVASTTAVAQVRTVFEEAAGQPPPALLTRCVAAANQACLARQREDPQLASMGTTLDLLLVEGAEAWWAHVGDSRIYRIAGGKASRLTKDHTRVRQMLEDGLLTAEEAVDHPQRNVLSRVVGREADCKPDVIEAPLSLSEGDAFLLCSDGLTDLVDDEEVGRIVGGYDPGRACRELIRLALGRGAPDNVTVQVVYKGKPRSAWQRMRTLVPSSSRPRQRRVRPKVVLGALMASLLLVGAAAVYLNWLRPRLAQPAPSPRVLPSRNTAEGASPPASASPAVAPAPPTPSAMPSQENAKAPASPPSRKPSPPSKAQPRP